MSFLWFQCTFLVFFFYSGILKKKKDGLLLFFIHFPNAFKFYLKVYEFVIVLD